MHNPFGAPAGRAAVEDPRAPHDGSSGQPAYHELLLDVSRSTATHRDVPGLIRELAAVLGRVAHFDRLALVLHDDERDVMHRHSCTETHPTTPPVTEMPTNETPSGLAWQIQQPVIIPRIDRDPRFPRFTKMLSDEGMRSICALPLTSPLRRLGALHFASREEDAFAHTDLEFLQEVASHVALAVDNALHHEAAQRAQEELAHDRDRLRLLLDINNTLVSNLEARPLFAAISACLRRVIAHDYTSLAVYDDKRNAFDMWALEFAGKGLIRENMTVAVEGSPAGITFATQSPMRFEQNNLKRLDSEIVRLLLQEGIAAVCCAPLTVNDRRIGTLNIGRRGEPFTADDATLLATVANQMAFAVENALAFQQIAQLKDKLAAEKIYLEDEIRTYHDFHEIVGDSPALKGVLHQVETVAPTGSAVLICGETGSGKELIARAVHDLSNRRARTFVKVNCAAIPTGLLESELFGHERGAFTGAIAQRIGRFELADGGTLFLDEVGDIPLELQPKLLRVLQEQEFERLGSTRTRRVDVRIVAATNRELEEMVAEGSFRNDLYYRLNVFPITVPPLRERREDIPHLVRYFVQKFERRMAKRIQTVPTEAMSALCAYDWPGNVRELENAIERAVILTEGSALRVSVAEFRDRTPAPQPTGTLEATEREAILRTLRDTNWVLGGPHGAASRLGLKRTTLQSRMQRLGIRRTQT